MHSSDSYEAGETHDFFGSAVLKLPFQHCVLFSYRFLTIKIVCCLWRVSTLSAKVSTAAYYRIIVRIETLYISLYRSGNCTDKKADAYRNGDRFVNW
jgi:hypothetical protein